MPTCGVLGVGSADILSIFRPSQVIHLALTCEDGCAHDRCVHDIVHSRASQHDAATLPLVGTPWGMSALCLGSGHGVIVTESRVEATSPTFATFAYYYPFYGELQGIGARYLPCSTLASPTDALA